MSTTASTPAREIERGPVRRGLALFVTAGLVAVGLAACASVPDQCVVEPGSASKLVSAKGDFGREPDVDFPTPLKAEKTQRSTIIEGHGDPLQAGQKIEADIALYDGTTGDLLTKSDYDGTSLLALTLGAQTLPGLAKGLQCVRPGSRVALAIAPDDAFGPQGGNPMLGVGENDTLVAVVDVRKAFLPRADGAPQPVPPGLPHVVLAPNGQPGITVPSTTPPKKLEIATLRKGDGATVERGEAVTVHYTGVLWKDNSVFDSSWERGEPATFLAEDASKAPSDASVPGVIEGLADALVGAKVGSQLLVVVPPELGYGSKGSGSVPGGATLVFVVDVLGVG